MSDSILAMEMLEASQSSISVAYVVDGTAVVDLNVIRQQRSQQAATDAMLQTIGGQMRKMTSWLLPLRLLRLYNDRLVGE
jgi:hypothetical protein